MSAYSRTQARRTISQRFIGHMLVATIGMIALVAATTSHAKAGIDRPNIIIVMADDMGYSDLGCFGSEIRTPHLDQLARDGLRFTQFYNAGRCCPTRASLLTGLYQHQTGIGHMSQDKGLPAYRGYLNKHCVTIAEALKTAGYSTLMTGKWHVGSARGQWPLDRGFERYFGTPTGGGIYFKESMAIRKTVYFVDGNAKVEEPGNWYITDVFTDHAIRFIDDASKRDKPFFLYLAHIAPHWPLQAKPEDIAKYKDVYNVGWDTIRQARYQKQVAAGIVEKHWKLSPRDKNAKPWRSMSQQKQADLAHRMAIYAAQIDSIDQNIGKLIAKLKATNRFDNTLLLFLSDNGCSAEGGPGGFSRGKKGAPIGTGSSYASAGLEWANVSDTPYRKYKMYTQEGGISTPLIAHWPTGIKRRGLEKQPGHIIDLMATCLDIAKTPYPAKRAGNAILPLEGTSLAPAFQGQAIERNDALYWEHQGNKAVRDGDWKLVAVNQGKWSLYNLKHDRTELNNVAAAYPTRVKELKAKWDAWARRVGVASWPLRRGKSKR